MAILFDYGYGGLNGGIAGFRTWLAGRSHFIANGNLIPQSLLQSSYMGSMILQDVKWLNLVPEGWINVSQIRHFLFGCIISVLETLGAI